MQWNFSESDTLENNIGGKHVETNIPYTLGK